MIEIKEYEEKYIHEISDIIIKNLMEVNIKDYGLKKVTEMAKEFEVSKLKETLKNRAKAFVALENGKVVGTSGLDKSWYNDDGEYWILTVFVNPENHGQNIGKLLIRAVEEFAKTIPAKKLVVPASLTAHRFYNKLGYEYTTTEPNDEGMYIMEKNA